jgi:tRNA splicing endonuclease
MTEIAMDDFFSKFPQEMRISLYNQLHGYGFTLSSGIRLRLKLILYRWKQRKAFQ